MICNNFICPCNDITQLAYQWTETSHLYCRIQLGYSSSYSSNQQRVIELVHRGWELWLKLLIGPRICVSFISQIWSKITSAIQLLIFNSAQRPIQQPRLITGLTFVVARLEVWASKLTSYQLFGGIVKCGGPPNIANNLLIKF